MIGISFTEVGDWQDSTFGSTGQEQQASCECHCWVCVYFIRGVEFGVRRRGCRKESQMRGWNRRRCRPDFLVLNDDRVCLSGGRSRSTSSSLSSEEVFSGLVLKLQTLQGLEGLIVGRHAR